jgi:HlyD family secretion protein
MTKRTWWILALVGGTALLLVWRFSGRGVEVETAQVSRRPMLVTVDEDGRTRVRNKYVIAAPVSGRLERPTVDEGDRVERGSVVARIHPRPEGPRDVGILRAELAAAESRDREASARLEAAIARAEQMRREAERDRPLVERGLVSRQAAERSELAALSAKEQVEALRAAAAAASADVRARELALAGAADQSPGSLAQLVYAPAAGRVLRVLEESERVVLAGTPIVEIGDAEGLEVIVDVLSEHAVRIRPGDPVRFEEWGGDEPLHGAVRLLEPAAFTKYSALGVEEQRVWVIADIFDAPLSLGAEFRVEARIVTWEGDDVLTVPTSALFQLGGEWQAFVVKGGRAVRRSVRIGHRSTELAEVLPANGGDDGVLPPLAEGDEVILFPSDEIDDGVRVTTSRAPPAPAPSISG